METPEECRRAAQKLEQTARLLSSKTARANLIARAHELVQMADRWEAKLRGDPPS
jgi:hypothetical protein